MKSKKERWDEITDVVNNTSGYPIANLDGFIQNKLHQNNMSWIKAFIISCILYLGITIQKESKCEYRHTQDEVCKNALIAKTKIWADSIAQERRFPDRSDIP